MKKINQPFNAYADYYDSFYQDKDYVGETKFILNVLKNFSKDKGKEILSLGCGTGTYEILLSQAGYQLVGVDFSDKMLSIAKEKAGQAGAKIKFFKGDVRKFTTPQKFSHVLALFNIIGYQNSDLDLENFIKTAGRHLKPGGLFMFDGWYQPAILKDRPQNRRKIIKLANGRRLERITTQTLNIEKSLLQITFQLKELGASRKIIEVKEEHPMRFFTLNEIAYFLTKNGFQLIKSCRFKHLQEAISEDYWDIFVIAKKI